jgi:predicted ribonuclease YlaK
MVRRQTEGSLSRGIVDTRKRLKSQTFTVHVALTRGERSGLTDDGAPDVIAETAL